MLPNITNKIVRKRKSELQVTPGENVRDAIIKAGLKAAEESGYAAGNTTERMVDIASNTGNAVDLGTTLVFGGESSKSLGEILYKTTKDIARRDSLCTGLCLVSATCETTAVCCSMIKIIPFRGRIYVCAKVVSKGCMSFRNACAGEGC